MKYTYIRITLILILALLTSSAKAYNDGLYFNSHSYATEKRTTLKLNDGNPVDVADITTMTFGMDLRERPFFGNIFCIKTDDGKHIDAIFSIQDRDKYKPALVVDGKLNQIDYDVEGGNNINVSITLDKKAGRITFTYAGRKITTTADLTRTHSATVIFGMHPNEENYPDVAPMNVRDITIQYDGTKKYFWELRRHNGRTSIDNISGEKAVATNGHWLADDHVNWKNKFTYKSKDKIQITFNPDDNIFYIVESGTVKCYNPADGSMKTVKVKGGHRAMMYSNYIGYNSKDKSLYTYNLQKGIVSGFNFATGRWSHDEHIADEPAYSNHSVAMNSGDSVFYAFGGYGFYRFHNNLFRINPSSGHIEELDYRPKMEPRTWAASALVGDKLYIFGGYGNASGEQEQPGVYYYDMSCIDLKTLKMEKLWTMEDAQNTSFQLSSEMFYNEADKSFYAAVTNSSGRLIKVWMNEPKWKIVTEGMNCRFGYKDLTFNIYKSTVENKIYAVIDRLQNDLTHEIAICSINLPVMDDFEVHKNNTKAKEGKAWWIYLLYIATAVVIIGTAGWAVAKRRKKNAATAKPTEASGKPATAADHATDTASAGAESALSDTTAAPATTNAAASATAQAAAPATATAPEQAPATATAAAEAKNDTAEADAEEEHKPEETVKYYTPTTGSIQMLGKFVVRDKDGNDITSLFTKRTRNLLLMLLLHSEASNKGIEIHLLDETLWQEMDDESARNNRNVYMRKLRVLLEKVGTIEVVNDKIYYRMNLGDNVFFDYHEALVMMNRMEYNDDNETTARTLELLFEGPLLPNYSYEWLDKFKADYSNAVISLLTRQLNNNLQNGNDSMALKIAETIMMHDPFSDKALATQCSILCRRHKKGIAKNVYDNFCKNYETCIGEKYHLSFAEVCK